MGYRSDVGLYLAPGIPFPEQKEKPDELIVDERGTLAVWRNVKWYSIDPDVMKINSCIEAIEDDKKYLLIVLGEDSTDTETTGNGWDNPFELSYVRKLTYEGSD